MGNDEPLQVESLGSLLSDARKDEDVGWTINEVMVSVLAVCPHFIIMEKNRQINNIRNPLGASLRVATIKRKVEMLGGDFLPPPQNHELKKIIVELEDLEVTLKNLYEWENSQTKADTKQTERYINYRTYGYYRLKWI